MTQEVTAVDPGFLYRSGVLPESDIQTPSFVVCEAGIRHNLNVTLQACGGANRLMPHVKTHRAPWVVDLLLAQGVGQFKAATLAEVEMVASRGAAGVTLAYPTVNPANIAGLVRLAKAHPHTRFTGMIDSDIALDHWRTALQDGPTNLMLRVDLDPDFGRTGAPMNQVAVSLARGLDKIDRFAGWHLYDGHVHGPIEGRRATVAAEAQAVADLDRQLAEFGISGDLVAGGSYTFDLWPPEAARHVSAGSWTYSSDQHDIERSDLGWVPAAFVLATVISRHADTVTLDVGSKAISPDKPLPERYRSAGEIVLMAEEHSVLRGTDHAIGDRLLLIPRHACTTAYLYDWALVRTCKGAWEWRPQLGNRRKITV